jgi:hypothetical protein
LLVPPNYAINHDNKVVRERICEGGIENVLAAAICLDLDNAFALFAPKAAFAYIPQQLHLPRRRESEPYVEEESRIAAYQVVVKCEARWW